MAQSDENLAQALIAQMEARGFPQGAWLVEIEMMEARALQDLELARRLKRAVLATITPGFPFGAQGESRAA